MLCTIVITCHNRADIVCDALDSIWAQTYRPIELIVIDDGSTDNISEIVQSWIIHHPNSTDFTTVFKAFPNGGVSVARNRGLALAHGEYIQFVDDDDWLYTNAIEKKVTYFQANPSIDLVVNQVEYVRNGIARNHSHISLPQHGEELLPYLLKHECLIAAVLMFRTVKLRSLGGWDDNLKFAEDAELAFRCIIAGQQIALVDEPLSAVRLGNPGKLTDNFRKRIPADFSAKLYLGLYRRAKTKGLDSNEIRIAFSTALQEDAKSLIRGGVFTAAHFCQLAAMTVSMGQTELPTLPSPLHIPLGWRLQFLISILFDYLRIIRALFRR